ncbi:MAG: hypothetical protein KC620_22375 [Myxococcales bacterium]|nr:hypothetical protein [Myxococcales bacterium]
MEHLVRTGSVAPRGTLLARVHPAEGPPEEIVAPFDGLVAIQRLRGGQAPQYARIIGLRRVVLATIAGRVTWVATLGPVGVTTLMALLDTPQGVRPHRAGQAGFVGERFVAPGQRVELGHPLVEIRGEELS